MNQESSSQPQWIEHALRRAPWRRQSQLAAMIALALIVAIIIGALYLAQATMVSTTGRQNEEMAAYRDRLLLENEQIRSEIAVMRSIPRLIERAQELGFVPASRAEIDYLAVQGYLPQQPESVAPVQEAQDVLPDYDETFDGWLQQQWQALVTQFEDWAATIGSDSGAGSN
ncbi:MAG: hypothetical protein JW910_20400 [Anaerolineae bacterium]|nr:hypothetical protein [Anaerolineae bacterium]